MLDRRNETSEELLNRAVAATRQLPVPSGPSAAIVSHTSAALREAAHRAKASLLERILIMPWTSKAIVTLAVAASVLVCLALSNLSAPRGHSPKWPKQSRISEQPPTTLRRK